MLLAGAGLMLRSFARLTAIDPGFAARNVLTLDVSTRTPNYKDPARVAPFYRQLMERLAALPGVEAAGAINHLPLSGDIWSNSVSIEGRPDAIPSQMPHAVIRVILPGYIPAMRIHLLEGRNFEGRDDEKGARVAIVNETMARRFWPRASAIGKHVKWFGEKNDWLTVIGVIRDVRQYDWAAPTQNEIYQPLGQSPKWNSMTLTVRTAQDPMTLAGAVEREVWAMDRDLPVSHVSRMEQVVANAVWQPRFWMGLLAVFAAVALLLAAIGVYGVMSYAMSRRTHEIGIRMALGARPASVLALVLRQGIALAATGIVLGAAGALGLTRLMASLLYDVTPTDPLTFTGVAILLAAVALTACYIPARRAARMDPVVALRYE
jgi:putative ABC transport system permease protein